MTYGMSAGVGKAWLDEPEYASDRNGRLLVLRVGFLIGIVEQKSN
jgi:hypothetical protein